MGYSTEKMSTTCNEHFLKNKYEKISEDATPWQHYVGVSNTLSGALQPQLASQGNTPPLSPGPTINSENAKEDINQAGTQFPLHIK